MKPAAFDYVRPDTLEEALDVLARHGPEARVLAGGQSLMAMMNMRLARPRILVDICALPGLARIDAGPAGLVVGAGVRQAALLNWRGLDEHQPLLAQALPWVGHMQTRSRGTVCGSVAHADPRAEIPLCLVALGGTVRLRGRRGARDVAAEAFHTGLMTTARRDDELIEAVRFPPRGAGAGHAFAEVGRRHGDFAIAAVAAVVDSRRIRLAVGGVADRPVATDFPLLDGGALDDALNALAWALDARDDPHATARYRRELVRQLGRRTIAEAMACRH